jgi:hypothetical protein
MNFALLYVFASFGFAFVLGYSKITAPLRIWLDHASFLRLDDDKIETANAIGYPKPIRFLCRWLLALLECPACLAFWLGAGAAFTPIGDTFPTGVSVAATALLLGFANCGAVLALGLLTKLIRTE